MEISKFKLHTDSWKNLDQDFKEFLETYFTKPLLTWFNLQIFSSIYDESEDLIIHTLVFKRNSNAIDQGDINQINEICTQDDDGQPQATYSLYLDTLILFIPTFL